MEVEEYIHLNKKEIGEILETGNISQIQGHPILISPAKGITKKNFLALLNLVFKFVSKIAIQQEDRVIIVCDKFKVGKIEPFETYVDESDNIGNDIKKMSEYI